MNNLVVNSLCTAKRELVTFCIFAFISGFKNVAAVQIYAPPAVTQHIFIETYYSSISRNEECRGLGVSITTPLSACNVMPAFSLFPLSLPVHSVSARQINGQSGEG